MGTIECEITNLHVCFKNKETGKILMEFDAKDTSTALEFGNQEKSEYGASAKNSETQTTEN